MRENTKKIYAIFWQHSRPYFSLTFVLAFSVIIANLGSVIEPLFYKQFFDTLFSANPHDPGVITALTSIIFSIFILQLITWFFRRISSFIDNHFQPRVMSDISNTCFLYLQKHSYRFFTNQFVGSLVRKVNRLVDAFEGVEERIVTEILPITVRIGAIIVVLFTRNETLAFLLLGWMAIYLVVNYFFTLYKLKYDVQAAAVNSEVTGQLADTITNNVNIKVFTGFNREFRQFRDLTDKQFRIWRFSLNLNEVMSMMQALMMISIQFVIFYFAVRFWQKGLLTIGDFALIQIYLLQIFDKLWNFGRIVRRMYKYIADAEEMVNILHTPHEVHDKPMAGTLAIHNGGIEFRDVDFTYTQTRTILKNFNLRIAPGQRVGLVGPSGAGKSTVATLALRFFDVSAGGIYVDGQNTADVTQESLRRAISYVPQDPILFHRTLMENIRYGKFDASDEEVMEAARLAHCDEFIAHLSQKYHTYVGERGIKLSGGERQRVAIARAILKNAPILVLDEATSSLDSHAESIIQDALENLMRGKTTLVIAHRLSTIMKMDRIIVMNEGRIVEEGQHEELIQKPEGLYKKLWDIQVGKFKSYTGVI